MLLISLHFAEKLKLELSQRHMAEMDQLSRAHKTQMIAAKMELERAVELKQQKVRECAYCLVGSGVRVITRDVPLQWVIVFWETIQPGSHFLHKDPKIWTNYYYYQIIIIIIQKSFKGV